MVTGGHSMDAKLPTKHNRQLMRCHASSTLHFPRGLKVVLCRARSWDLSPHEINNPKRQRLQAAMTSRGKVILPITVSKAAVLHELARFGLEPEKERQRGSQRGLGFAYTFSFFKKIGPYR